MQSFPDRADFRQPTPQPASCPPTHAVSAATGVPDEDRRILLLRSELRVLEDHRRWGDSYLRAETARCIREDIAALGGRSS